MDATLTLEVGILTIFTLFFTFAGIKSNIQNEFKHQILQYIRDNNPADEEIDYILSNMSKRQSSVIRLLEDIGRTFRICIYLGIVIIIGLVFNNFLKYGWLQFIIILFLLIQLWGLFLNVHRFKVFYELDLEEEIEEHKIRLKFINKAISEKNYEILENINDKRKNSLRDGLILDVKSLFNR